MIVATRGRSEQLKTLLIYLRLQTLRPRHIVLVGTSAADVAVDTAEFDDDLTVTKVISVSAGSAIQRNKGIEWLVEHQALSPDSFTIFFDDDFRPDVNWVRSCDALFRDNLDIVGITGLVLADGGHGYAVSEDSVEAYLAGTRRRESHWAQGSMRDIATVYGCNMAFRNTVFGACTFDEKLPLYAWQEDRDFSGQAKSFGRIIFAPVCRGVHLGARSGRTSGMRLGYSQISNLIYLSKKGTVSWSTSLKFMIKSVASNTIKSLNRNPNADYVGRLSGNLLAIRDTFIGRCDPGNIVNM
ncbi:MULTISPECIES: glycosyltransferase family A protein [unclassified Methylobacterium]|uniref:glycosyltransferase family 2 protein n=1 Tax=unclassified Methylobacterium TaxID=2615210 RepID=UPI0022699804|nr:MULTISPECIES: glycosyltransferase family A protein [unclassified Methylobacterium]